MADKFSVQRHKLYRPESALQGLLNNMLQRLEKAFQRFWQRLKARMSTPHTQHQVRKHNVGSRNPTRKCETRSVPATAEAHSDQKNETSMAENQHPYAAAAGHTTSKVSPACTRTQEPTTYTWLWALW
ncbi:Hypothetical predicted protein [Pelobates cultripes]|uniref:Uncharacterized protein n=1 Tax=Pelobates cultripes TaxID=61616 RepID=A0AAD1TJE2_PELCU|nr:Hypothetical predicted protein [Pelobates cultripes]